MLTIEKDLKDFAQDFYISKNGSERPKIETSLASISKRLKQEFGKDILSIEIFGSYKRKTILPRYYDSQSDIDLLIVFDHRRMNVSPATYRKYLHDFADQYYPNSLAYKSQPTVVLELNHIKYDLVPAHTRKEGWIFITEEAYIPKNNTDWVHTDIKKFSDKLEAKNKQYNFNVKRIIRLLKAWNAMVNYPITSYTLEQIVADMNFSGETLETGFFYAINQLPSSWNLSSTTEKIRALKDNAKNLKLALKNDDLRSANRFIRKILPLT